jgi:general secretion pathway protein M
MGSTWLIGRRGQALALLATVLVALTIWAGAVQPLVSWYAERAETLLQRQALAERMERLAATLPSLQRRAEARSGSQATVGIALSGASDAIAGAMLQEHVQTMAISAGATLASVETLPVEPAGAWRRIGLRVTLTAPWPVLVRLLQSLDQATPQMLVDDLRMRSTLLVAQPVAQPLQTSFTVYAFRAGTATAVSRP